MFIDASAFIAIVTGEAAATEFIDVIEAVTECFTSPIAIGEAALSICRKRHSSVAEAHADVIEFLSTAAVEVVAVETIDAKVALDAFSRFGKGLGHPAQLNMSDCFAYALASRQGAGLLFKGDDFDKTGVAREFADPLTR